MAPNPLAPRTPAQIAALAAQQTHAALAPERAAIRAAQAAARRAQVAQQQRIAGFAQAAAAQLQAGLPQVQQGYENAISAQQGLASGFSQEMRDRLANVPGAPAGAADASYSLGGYVPGSRLSADAVAAYSQAQAQQAGQLGLGQIGLRSAAATAQEQEKQYADQLTVVAAKGAGLRQQALDSLNKQELDKLAEKASLDKLDADWAKDYARLYGYNPKTGEKTLAGRSQENLALSRKHSYDLQVKKWRLAKKKANEPETQHPSEWLSKSNKYLTATDGTPILLNGKKQRISPNAGKTDLKAAAEDARELRGKPIETPAAVQSTQADAGYQVGQYLAKPGAKGVYSSPTDEGGFVRTTNDLKKARYDSDYTPQRAIDYLMTTYHLTKSQARALLKNAGWFG